MSIDQSHPDDFSVSLSRFFKPSHRTLPEQGVGLAIFFIASFSVAFYCSWLAQSFFQTDWYCGLVQASWAIPSWAYGPAWSAYHLLLPLSMWSLWRRYSLHFLKLELFSFLALFLLQVLWGLSLFVLHEALLALVALLLLWCNQLFCILLFWKKERTSSQLLFLPFLWNLYLIALNMVICTSNP